MRFECTEVKTVIHQQIKWQALEELQRELIQQVKKDPSLFFLLISEPSSTFTFGRNASRTDLIWSESQLKKNQVEVAAVSRGGKWTYHGPGQILIYPIVHLSSLGFSSKEARRFVETLRHSVKNCLESWHLPVQSEEEPFGLFIKEKKLVSFGLSFEGGISSHGLSVCFSSQQFFFNGIHPCGHSETQFTSLLEYLPHLKWCDAAEALVESIKKGFKFN
ncbi:MAG: lipoyl(octanoyl) transferase LipB [Pseudomonadota bacterium]